MKAIVNTATPPGAPEPSTTAAPIGTSVPTTDNIAQPIVDRSTRTTGSLGDQRNRQRVPCSDNTMPGTAVNAITAKVVPPASSANWVPSRWSDAGAPSRAAQNPR